MGTQAAPAPLLAPAVAEAQPSHWNSHSEEQRHCSTDDVAELILHDLCDSREQSA